MAYNERTLAVGIGSAAMTAIAVTAGALDAPRGVWIALAVVAGFLMAYAVVLWVRAGRKLPPSAELELAGRFREAQHDLTGFLRDRSERAPGPDAEAQRETLRAEGRNPGRLVHGDDEWQRETIRLWREGLRTNHMLLAEEAEQLGACSAAEREFFNPKDIRSVQELWDARRMGARIIERLGGRS